MVYCIVFVVKNFAITSSEQSKFLGLYNIRRMHNILVVLGYWNSLAINSCRNSCGDYSDESVAGGALIHSIPVTEQHPTVGIAVNGQRQSVVAYIVGRVFFGARGRRGANGS